MNVYTSLFIFDYSLDILHNLICKFCFSSDTSSTDAEQTISDDLKKCKRFTMKIVLANRMKISSSATLCISDENLPV